MRRLFLRVLALAFAISVLFGLVAHASLTSGCSKPEPLAREPEPAATAVSAAAPVAAASANAPEIAPSIATANAAADAPTDAKRAQKPGAPANKASKGSNANPPSDYMGGSKSGRIFRPQE